MTTIQFILVLIWGPRYWLLFVESHWYSSLQFERVDTIYTFTPNSDNIKPKEFASYILIAPLVWFLQE
jgi:hypothetical protein